jgi:4-oxalocrotonate tautomerase
MPYPNLKIAGAAGARAVAELAGHLTELATGVLGKKREVTALAVEPVAAGQWLVAGRPLAAGRMAFFLEVKVTEGTNTKDEKAAFLKGVHAAARAVLGFVDPASYVVIDEVRADAWGYAGVTQERRYVQGKALAEGRGARLRAL